MKIVQMMPAQIGWRILEGKTREENRFVSIAGWGLTEEGRVLPLTCSGEGAIAPYGGNGKILEPGQAVRLDTHDAGDTYFYAPDPVVVTSRNCRGGEA